MCTLCTTSKSLNGCEPEIMRRKRVGEGEEKETHTHKYTRVDNFINVKRMKEKQIMIRSVRILKKKSAASTHTESTLSRRIAHLLTIYYVF